ncbi:MAG: FAD-dependent oxidoreductase, partial [Gemmatimonadales bacterium]|nr:FAD-dependent oxidoreductase [Gemmatimonadales bacterium]
MSTPPRIVIIGAGPTGLGAAWRLQELGHTNWMLVEAADHPGGLAASVVDPAGFTWDLGGHVLFSHYQYFDRLMDAALGDAWAHHEREAWVWMRNRWIPYPLQNN